MTLTVPVLCSAPEVVFIVTGEEKAEAVERAFGRPPGPETPSSLIRSARGRTRVVADAAAACAIDRLGSGRCIPAAWPPPSPSRSWTS